MQKVQIIQIIPYEINWFGIFESMRNRSPVSVKYSEHQRSDCSTD